MVEAITAFWAQYGNILLEGTWETLVMVAISTALAYLIGVPLGVALIITRPQGIRPHRVFYEVLGWIVNVGRSLPFAILLVALMPFTRLLVGTAIGVKGAIPPLVISAAPFVARMVETSLSEVDAGVVEAAQSMGASTLQLVWKVYLPEAKPSLVLPFVARMVETSLSEVDAGVVEAAQSMGASTLQLVWKVYLPEAKPSLVLGGAISVVTILAYTAIAGMVGAGGLGNIAIQYGHSRGVTSLMWVTVVILIVFVQIVQLVFNRLSRSMDKRLDRSSKQVGFFALFSRLTHTK